MKINAILLLTLLFNFNLSVRLKNVCQTLESFNKEKSELLGGGKIDVMVQEILQKKSLEEEENLLEFLGKGAFGAVFGFDMKNSSNNSSLNVALKYVKVTGEASLADFWASEIYFLQKSQATIGVPRFHGCFYLITPIVPLYRGNLKNGLYQRKKPLQNKIEIYIMQEKLKEDLDYKNLGWLLLMSPKDRFLFYKDLFLNLKEISELGIVHSDIKPNNIMLDMKEKPRLIDLGLAVDEKRYIRGGTPCYKFPQQRNELADPKFDLYSMGVTVAVMESSDDSICGFYDNIRLNCLNNPAQRVCHNNLVFNMYTIFNEVFETPQKENYVLSKCEDYGCLFLSLIKMNVNDIPTVDEVLAAFDKIIEKVDFKAKVLKELKEEQEFNRKQKKKKEVMELMDYANEQARLNKKAEEEVNNMNNKKIFSSELKEKRFRALSPGTRIQNERIRDEGIINKNFNSPIFENNLRSKLTSHFTKEINTIGMINNGNYTPRKIIKI